MLWQLELARFGVLLVISRVRALWLDERPMRKVMRDLCRRELKRHNVQLLVHGKPVRGFLAANHTSYLDGVVSVALFPAGFIGKIEVRDYPLIGPLAASLGMLWVRREEQSSRDAAKAALNVRDATAEPLWIYPEGKTTTFGTLGKFKMGVFKAAEASGHVVQPLAMCYNDRYIDWTGSKSVLLGIRTFYSTQRPLKVRCFWLKPFHVAPGEAHATAERLNRTLRAYVERFEVQGL